MRILIFLSTLLTSPVAHAQTLADLAWLTGCWRTEAPREAEAGAVITEVWIAPPMLTMLGYSYTIGEGEVQGWEQTRIEMIDGAPAFIAMPNGGPPVRFDLVETSIGVNVRRPYGGVVFANPQHDYPQRVEYLRDGNRLTATISGANGADPIVFSYRRIRCEAALRP